MIPLVLLGALIVGLLVARRARKRRSREHVAAAPVVAAVLDQNSGPRLDGRRRGRQGNL